MLQAYIATAVMMAAGSHHVYICVITYLHDHLLYNALFQLS